MLPGSLFFLLVLWLGIQGRAILGRRPTDAELAIYSVDGRRVRTLARGPLAAGSYHFTWSGDDDDHRPVAPGVYYARLTAGTARFTYELVQLR